MNYLENIKFKTNEDEYDNTQEDKQKEILITEGFNNYLDTFNT